MKKKLLLLSLICFLGVTSANSQKMGNFSSGVANMVASESSKEKLFEAVESGKLASVQEAVKKASELSFILVNVKDKDGKTPLMIASEKGYYDIVKYLAGLGAKVNTTDKNNYTALCYAAGRGYDLRIIEYLVNLNAKVDYKCGLDWKGFQYTPLMHVAAQAYGDFTFTDESRALLKSKSAVLSQIVKLLVEKGADVNFSQPTVPSTTTVVDFFAGADQVDIVRYLFSKGAESHDSITRWLVNFCNMDMLKTLSENGVRFWGDDLSRAAACGGDIEAYVNSHKI